MAYTLLYFVIALFSINVNAKYADVEVYNSSVSYQMDNSNDVMLFYHISSELPIDIYVLDAVNKKSYDIGSSFEYDEDLSVLNTISSAIHISEYKPKSVPGYVEIASRNGNITHIRYIINDELAKVFSQMYLFWIIVLAVLNCILILYIVRLINKRKSLSSLIVSSSPPQYERIYT